MKHSDLAAGSAPIVCATRGGQGSRAVRARAVALAVDEQRPLIFLFVADTGPQRSEGLFGTGPAVSRALIEEMAWTGRVLLRIARLQATRSGVDADIAVREGRVRAEIERFAKEVGASTVLLGAPRGVSDDISGDSPVARLARSIRDGAGVRVCVVAPE